MMTEPGPEAGISLPLIVLSVTQLIGWGVVGFLAVVGRDVAADLQLPISTVFAGTTFFYVTMGACAPFLARLFLNVGARRVMIGGTVLSAGGLALVSLSHAPILYFLGWLILGAAGSATLTTPAHILLNEIAGRGAARAIATLMLVSGLSSTVFWPLTSLLAQHLGWRGACLAYAALLLVVCLPLHVFGLPRGRQAPSGTGPATAATPTRSDDATFYLIVGAIALNAFVTFGFSAILIELLKAEGLSPARALAFGSALGIIQIAARAFNLVGDRRWDGLATGVAASAILCLSLAVLLVAGGSTAVIAIFLLLYGVGSGALAVARSTIPLVFYDKAAFARALTRIALPLNWISAISPPLLISLMTHFGGSAVLVASLLCSLGAMAILLLLRKRRPQAGGAALAATLGHAVAAQEAGRQA